MLAGSLGVLLLAAGSGAAFAQDSPPSPADEAAAESLFEAGRTLLAEGRAAEACPKFEESNRIAPSAGTTLNLGKCLEAQGKTASAWAAYKRAIGLARATGQTRHVTAGEKFVEEVAPRLSRLRVEAPDAPSGLVVRRDGVALGAAALGVDIAVDPGEYAIEASAPGRVTFRTTVLVKADGDRAELVVPALGPAMASAPPPPPPGAGPREAPPNAEGSHETLRLVGFVVGGAGVMALTVGSIFGVMTLSDASAAEQDAALCPSRRCTEAGEAAIADAETKAWVANVGLGLGAAALLTGGALVTWSYVDQNGAVARPRAALRPWAAPSGAGLSFGGAL